MQVCNVADTAQGNKLVLHVGADSGVQADLFSSFPRETYFLGPNVTTSPGPLACLALLQALYSAFCPFARCLTGQPAVAHGERT